jgi:hypothetical protein
MQSFQAGEESGIAGRGGWQGSWRSAAKRATGTGPHRGVSVQGKGEKSLPVEKVALVLKP